MTNIDTAHPLVLTYEEFCASHQAFRFSWDVATNRLPNTSEGQRKRIQRHEQKLAIQNFKRRINLKQLYDKEVAEGRIRPPTRDEMLIKVARGMDENAAVQAARRLLQKRGISWEAESDKQ